MYKTKLDYIEITVCVKCDLTWDERKELIENYNKQGFNLENQCKNTYYFVKYFKA